MPTPPAPTSTERELLAAIDEDELLTDLRELVAIGSVGGTPGEVEAQRWCAARLQGLGLDVEHWRFDLAAERDDPGYPGEEVDRAEAWGCVARTPATTNATPALALAGHVDVVPPGDPATWTGGDPYALRLTDGRAQGRGTCDMKAGVVASIAAAAALRRTGSRLRRPLAVHTVVGEEDGGLGAAATLRAGHLADACVIGEPTDHTVVRANAGSLTFRLEVRGRATHGSTRTAGVSALDAAWPVLAALRDLEEHRNRDPGEPFAHLDLVAPLSVGIVHAGDWASTVPDLLVAEGRYGVLPGEPPAAARSAFEAAVRAAGDADPWLAEHPVRVSWPGGAFASGALPSAHPLADRVADAITAAGGRRPVERGAPYGSDLRLYAAAGVPTVQYGPGDVRHAHAVDEHVRLADVALAARTYALLALRACT